MFLQSISFILLLSSALRLKYQEYNQIEIFAIVSLPKMTVKMPCSMLTPTTVPRGISGEIADSHESLYNHLTFRCVSNGNGGWNIEVLSLLL